MIPHGTDITKAQIWVLESHAPFSLFLEKVRHLYILSITKISNNKSARVFWHQLLTSDGSDILNCHHGELWDL